MVSAPLKDALLSRGTMHVYDSLGSSEAVGFGVALTTAPGQGETARFRLGPNARLLASPTTTATSSPARARSVCSRCTRRARSATTRTPPAARRRSAMIDGRLHAIPGDQATARRRRHPHAPRARLELHQLRRREDLAGGGRGGAEGAPRRRATRSCSACPTTSGASSSPRSSRPRGDRPPGRRRARRRGSARASRVTSGRAASCSPTRSAAYDRSASPTTSGPAVRSTATLSYSSQHTRCSRTSAAARAVSSCTKKCVPGTVTSGDAGAFGLRRRTCRRAGRCRRRTTTVTSAVERREVLERRGRAVGTRAALEEPRLDLGRAGELHLPVGPVAEPPAARSPPAPRAPSRSAADGSRTTPAPSPGRPTPHGACGPWPTCGSRHPAPGSPRPTASRSASHSSSFRTSPGRSRSTRIPVPPPERLARGATTSSSPRWSSMATTSPAAATNAARPRPTTARRWCRGPAGRSRSAGSRPAARRASGSNTPAQNPLGCRSTSGGPSPPQSSAPMVSPSCSTDHALRRRRTVGMPSGARYRTLADRSDSPTPRAIGYPAGHADRSRNPLAL